MPGRLGPFTPLRTLGVGAGGTVWLARGPGGLVAVKVPATERARRRLIREGELLARLDLDCLPGVVERAPDGSWLALELVAGDPADNWAIGRDLPVIVELLARTAEALHTLHGAGVAHGDVKPANVLVEPGGVPRLVDLGVAVHAADGPGFQGTLGYAAPELLHGGAPSPAADLYALGALAYLLITGQPAFPTDEPAALSWLPAHSLPEPPGTLRIDLPDALERAVLDLLARTPERRPRDGRDAAQRLRRGLLEGRPGKPVIGRTKVREALRRMVVEAADGAVIVAVLLGPPGCGARNISHEARRLAEREGLVPLGRTAAARARVPLVIELDGDDDDTNVIIAGLRRRALPALALVRSHRPRPDLQDARVLPIPGLSMAEIELLLTVWGADPGRAPELHRATQGLPGAIRGTLLQARQPARSRILDQLRRGPREVDELARAMGLTGHALLDLADDLLNNGLLIELDGGKRLGLRGEAQVP